MKQVICFNWVNNGTTMVAKDPVDDNLRWLIRSAGSERNPSFTLHKVYGGSDLGFIYVETNHSLLYLRWKAALSRINELADVFYNAPYMIKEKEKLEKIREFLDSMASCWNPNASNTKHQDNGIGDLKGEIPVRQI